MNYEHYVFQVNRDYSYAFGYLQTAFFSFLKVSHNVGDYRKRLSRFEVEIQFDLFHSHGFS